MIAILPDIQGSTEHSHKLQRTIGGRTFAGIHKHISKDAESVSKIKQITTQPNHH